MAERGRHKGRKDSKPSEARLLVNRENASRPRIKPSEQAREKIMAAKDKLAAALAGPGVRWIEQIIREGPARWETIGREGGGHERVLVNGSADFTWAVNFAADRAGMPRRSEAEITQPGGFVITVDDARGGLGWPGVAVGGVARDDGEHPSVAN